MFAPIAGLPHRRSAEADDGFSLIELVVAMAIIGGVLLGLVALQTRAMVTVSHAKERQQSTAVANLVLESLRALPWAVVSNGSLGSAIPADDPYVSGGKLTVPGEPITGEPIVLNGATTPPLSEILAGSPLLGPDGTNVTRHIDPATGREFTARSYVTESALGNGELNLTVIIEWTNSSGESKSTIVRSTIFNTRDGCGSSGNKPFATACQDFYSADAGSTAPSISISGALPNGEDGDGTPNPILSGATENEVVLSPASLGVEIDAAQSSTVRTQLSHGSLTVFDLDGDQIRREAGDTVGVTSSDSVTSDRPRDMTVSLPSKSLGTHTVNGGNAKLVLSTSARRGSGTVHTSTQCESWALAGQPCGFAALERTTDTLKLEIDGTTIPLLEIEQNPVRVETARFNGGMSVPGSTEFCEKVEGSGCIQSRVSQGQFNLLMPKVVEIRGGLESGSSSGHSQIDRRASVARNGNYKALWDGGPQGFLTGNGFNLESEESFEIYSSGSTTVTADASISTADANVTESEADPECRDNACTLKGAAQAVIVSVTYNIDSGGSKSAFSVNVTVGAADSKSSYKASPEAWEDD